MTKEEIYKTEPNPENYLKMEREIRRRRIEEVAGGLLILLLLGITITLVQVGYGIWG